MLLAKIVYLMLRCVKTTTGHLYNGKMLHKFKME